MSSPRPTGRLWFAFVGVLLLTTLAVTADRLRLLSGVRVVLHDALSPGRLVIAAISDGGADNRIAADAVDPQQKSVETQLQDLEQQRRQLLIENAQLHNRLRQIEQSNGHSARQEPLAGFDLISARVLSRHGMPVALRQAMIDAGRTHGLTQSELVLDAQGILLDQGIQNGISDGRPVLAGSVVMGRVEQAGRWVSHLLPVTDESFSSRVRLIRRSSRGSQMGNEGILEGTGDACRISGIPDTASVAVGDEVYSADINGLAGPSLYYGTVSVAEFEAAAGWSIHVNPAGTLSVVDHVVIVVPTVDTNRLTAGLQESATGSSR